MPQNLGYRAYLGHFLVWEEELLVLWVLEVVGLEVGPQVLDALSPGGFGLPDDGGKVGADLHGCSESGSLRHLESSSENKGKEDYFQQFLD